MKHWLCTNKPGCQHEWDGENPTCSWCGSPGKLLEETKPPPYSKMLKGIQRHFEKSKRVRKFYQ